MWTKAIITTITALGISNVVWAQDVTNVTANSEDISQNLDLKAVASIFGDAEDLKDFERQLNDPEMGVSNLDMNNDGYVDYIRVVESGEGNLHVILLQAVIGKDQYQDVATIEVEKDDSGQTHVQVVGDVYMYGPDYIIEPVYVRPPVFFSFFWRPYYSWYWSPWYWGYYPGWYRPWRPFPFYTYYGHCNAIINVNHSYTVVNTHRSSAARTVHASISRSDYAVKHPEQAFAQRNKGTRNKAELPKAQAARNNGSATQPTARSTGKQVQRDWKPAEQRETSRTQTTTPQSGKTQSSQRAVDPNWKPNEERATRPSSNDGNAERSTRPSKQTTERGARPSGSSKANKSSSSRSKSSTRSSKPKSSSKASKPGKQKSSASRSGSSRSSSPKSNSSRSSAPKSGSKRSK